MLWQSSMSELQLNRIGFYPVSARDYLDPLRMLKGYVERLIFCDIACTPRGAGELRELRHAVADEGLPEPSFLLGDAIFAMQCLRPVDVFFLRRDSGDGEGGSGLYLLGREKLAKTLSMIVSGGLLVTDQRNGGDWFSAMVSRKRNEWDAGDCRLRLLTMQPWADHRLFAFKVDRVLSL